MDSQSPPTPGPTASNWVWPHVDTLASAKRATLYGFWASLILASLLILVTGLSISQGNTTRGSSFIRAALFALFAFGILKTSRTAAGMALLEYVLGLADNWLVQGFSLDSLTFPILFVSAFVNSIRGTFAYRTLEAAAAGRKPPAGLAILRPLFTAPIEIRNTLLARGAAEASIRAAEASAGYLAAILLASLLFAVGLLYAVFLHPPVSAFLNSPSGDQAALLIVVPIAVAALAGAIASIAGLTLAAIALFQTPRARILSAFVFNGALLGVYTFLILLAIAEAA